MINESELGYVRPQALYREGEEITFILLQKALQNCAIIQGISLTFRNDQVSYGRIIENCIVLYHPEHERDFFNFTIRIKRQGKNAIVVINDFGLSTLFEKACSEFEKLSGEEKWELEEEKIWYTMIMCIFDDVFQNPYQCYCNAKQNNKKAI